LGAKRPSLNALRALEATVRLSSMTAAAGELSVTHGAVSRHIKSLEEMFGIPLLLRGARSVQATPEGARLATELSRAFDLIASSVEQLQPGPLTLSCSSTIMMSWLIPRLVAFHEQHPDIELRFNMNYDRIDFVRDEISVAIRNSMIEHPKEVAWYEPEYGGVHNVWVAGDTLYMGAYNAGFRAFDISGELRGDLRAQNREIAHVNPIDKDGFIPNAAMTWGVVVKNGLAYVNDFNNGLFVVRLEPRREDRPLVP